jgi:hypothetical protein
MTTISDAELLSASDAALADLGAINDADLLKLGDALLDQADELLKPPARRPAMFPWQRGSTDVPPEQLAGPLPGAGGQLYPPLKPSGMPDTAVGAYADRLVKDVANIPLGAAENLRPSTIEARMRGWQIQRIYANREVDQMLQEMRAEKGDKEISPGVRWLLRLGGEAKAYLGQSYVDAEKTKLHDQRGRWDLEIPPAETIPEKVGDTVIGLGSAILQILVTRKYIPKFISESWKTPLAFEIENLVNGGTPGAGLAMGGALQGIGAIPAKSLAGKAGKVAAESSIFGGLAAAGGGDETDIVIAMLIPPSFAGYRSMRKFYKGEFVGSKTADELTGVARDARTLMREHAELRRFVGQLEPDGMVTLRKRHAGQYKTSAGSRAIVDLIDTRLAGEPLDQPTKAEREQPTDPVDKLIEKQAAGQAISRKDMPDVPRAADRETVARGLAQVRDEQGVVSPIGEKKPAEEITDARETAPGAEEISPKEGAKGEAGEGVRLRDAGQGQESGQEKAAVVEPPTPGSPAPPPPPGVTSIQNAIVDQERAARGLPPAMEAARQAFSDVWDEAMAVVVEDPTAPAALVSELQAKPRAVSGALEDALLLHRQITLQNDYDKSIERLEAAREGGDPVEIARAETSEALLASQLVEYYDVDKKVGTETGRALNARKMLADEAFTLMPMLAQTRKAKGTDLTAEDRAAVVETQRDIAGTQQAFDDYVQEADDQAAQAQSKDALEKLKKRVAKAKARIQSEPGPAAQDEPPEIVRVAPPRRAGPLDNPAVGKLARQLAEQFVAEGVTDRDELIDAVYAELLEVVPDLTRRQAMDAISGYGQYKLLDQDEIKVQLRDLKGQMQQVGKLQDMVAGLAPLKTGVQRREPSDEERRLIQEVNEAKKKYGFEVTDPVTQLKSALDGVKTRLRNQIADLEEQLATGTQLIRDRAGLPYDDEATALRERRDALRAEYDEMFGQRELSDERRVKMAIAAVEKSAAEYERRVKERDLFPGRKPSRTPMTAELAAARARRDAWKEQLRELQEVARPKKTAEQIALQSLKTRLVNRTAELKEKLARSDFAPKPKRKPLSLDKEAMRLRKENLEAKLAYMRGLEAFKWANRSAGQKVTDLSAETWRTIRSVLTSADVSAVARQGGFFNFGHPIQMVQELPQMFRAGLSRQGAVAAAESLRERPNWALYQRAGLELTELEGVLGKMEEAYMGRWTQKIPIVAASARAYVAFLNRQRADMFDALVAFVGRKGTVSDAEAEALANFVNGATGRGTLWKFKQAAVGLATVFFSPRYATSRFQLLFGAPFFHEGATGRVKVAIAKEYARTALGLGIFYSMVMAAAEMFAAFYGGEPEEYVQIESDPRSADFGKIKIGNTRIDPLFGLSQTTVLLSRVAGGQTKDAYGRLQDLSGKDKPFGKSDIVDVLARFLRAKLSPAAGAVVDVTAREGYIGEPVTVTSLPLDLSIPLALRDVYEAIEEHGISKGVALGLTAIFGLGLQTYQVDPGPMLDALAKPRPVKTAKGDETFFDTLGRWQDERDAALEWLGKQPLTVEQLEDVYWEHLLEQYPRPEQGNTRAAYKRRFLATTKGL